MPVPACFLASRPSGVPCDGRADASGTEERHCPWNIYDPGKTEKPWYLIFILIFYLACGIVV